MSRRKRGLLFLGMLVMLICVLIANLLVIPSIPDSIPPFLARRVPKLVAVHRVGAEHPAFSIRVHAGFNSLLSVERAIAASLPTDLEVRGLYTTSGSRIKRMSALQERVFVLVNDELWVWPAFINQTLPLHLNDRYVSVTSLSTRPRVLRVHDLLSDDECAHLISVADPQMVRSKVTAEGVKSSDGSINEARTSSQAWLFDNSDKVVDVVRRRVAELVKVPSGLAEAMQVLHYSKGQHYWAHHDYFDLSSYGEETGGLFANGHNRFITVIFFLNTVRDGGETVFPFAYDKSAFSDWGSCERGLRVKPVRGDAIIFYNLLETGVRKGKFDWTSLHGGCDVRGDEEKWAANYWIRNKAAHSDNENYVEEDTGLKLDAQ